MSELTCLELSVLLWVAHISFRPARRALNLAIRHICSRSRDTSRPPRVLRAAGPRARLATMSRITVRSSRSALALIATQRAGGIGALGATIWILVAHRLLADLYDGVIYVRTALWAISIIGLVMMLSRLIGW